MPVKLRALEPSDAELLYAAENDTSLWGVSGTVAPYSLHALREYAENYDADPFASGQLRLVIVDAATEEAVGLLDFYDISQLHSHAWVGIYVCPGWRRRGAALEALGLAATYAHLRLRLSRLGAKVLGGVSPGSLRLFSAAGYTPCGTLPAWYYAEGRMHDVTLLSLPLGG